MTKTIVVITDKETFRETVFMDIRELDFAFEERNVVEIIVTDKCGSTHHYPKEHYDLEVYEQIPNCNVKRVTRPEEEYADYVERLIKADSARTIRPSERAFMYGK